MILQKKKLKEMDRDERELVWQDVAFKAAHKIGNPIDAIDTYVNYLTKKLSANDIIGAKEILVNIEECVNEIKYVLSEFKQLNKIYENKLVYTDLVKIIHLSMRNATEIKTSLTIINDQLIAESKQSENSRQFSPTSQESNTVLLFIDREKIKQCFDELISNSIHFFDPNKIDKRIDITIEYLNNNIPKSLKKDRKYIRVIYSDNGVGIPNDIKDKIFTPFFTTYQHGTGLGLAIIRKIIELHEGLIFENGQVGTGAKFEIYLPINTSI